MTSAVGRGRGVPEKQTKGTHQLICDKLQGVEEVKKSENFADIFMGAPYVFSNRHLLVRFPV